MAPAGIFILAPLPRCGTNYLWDVLRLHPDLEPGRPPLWEDYLLKHADRLASFVREVGDSWDPVWGRTDHLAPELLASLGKGLISFLAAGSERRVLTKSPTTKNLEVFFDLFPQTHLLLLVRDGRAVAESGARTFGWTIEWAARNWRAEVRRILAFERRHRGCDHPLRLIRYEDLVEDLVGTTKEILGFLDLEIDQFDFDAAANLPVRGSSCHAGPGRSEVHWDPVARDTSFDPIGRWRTWGRQERGLFEEVAGAELSALGYALDPRAA